METEMETHEQKKDRLIMDRRNSKIGGDALEGTGMTASEIRWAETVWIIMVWSMILASGTC